MFMTIKIRQFSFFLVQVVLVISATTIPNFMTTTTATTTTTNMENNFEREGRIVGGWDTSILYHPYQIALLLRNRFVCGGAIVSSRAVITAAHCVHSSKTGDFSVRMGSSSHDKGGVKIPIERVVIHERYTRTQLGNDIAILVLDRTSTSTTILSSTIQPIQMATDDSVIPANAGLFVSGWGTTSEGGSISPILKYTIVGLIDEKSCAKSYRGIADLTNEMFCAGVPSGGRDSCQGDSGGPIVIRNANGLIRLVGIVSFGIGCASPKYPGVYTKVSAFRMWIDKKINEI